MADKSPEAPLEITSRAELESILMGMWPTGWVERDALFAQLGISIPVERNIVTCGLGNRSKTYAVTRVAEFFWMRSNYADDEDASEYGPGSVLAGEPTHPGGRLHGATEGTPRGGIRDQTSAVARIGASAGHGLTALALADRMAQALDEILREARRSGGPQEAADLAALLSEWKRVRRGER